MINLTIDKACIDNNQITKAFVLKACFHENQNIKSKKKTFYQLQAKYVPIFSKYLFSLNFPSILEICQQFYLVPTSIKLKL